jgi:uncharacterized membrane protein YdjX (TVP38/TMEM64 family)
VLTVQFFIWGVAAVQVIAILALIIITPTRIMQWFNNFGLRIRGMGVKGWFLCILLVGKPPPLGHRDDTDILVLASHPPLFGFAGSMSLIGFTYGIWPGFLIASFASMLGAAIAFLSVRVSVMIPNPDGPAEMSRHSSQKSRWGPSGMHLGMS